MFIFDASFVRGTKWEILENIAQRKDIGISPITAIELASHLCESPKEQSYNRSKINFLKCKLFKMLDDPFWIAAQRGIITAHNSRQHEASMIGRLFPIVESSGHLEDLLSKYIEFPEGHKVKCNIMEYLSKVLAEEENVFRKTVSRIWTKAPLNPLLNGSHTLQPDNFGRALMNSIKDNHLSRKHSLAYIFGMSMYFGYIMDRMIVYANKRPPGIGDFNYNMIDQNDCEDAFLCLHVNLNSKNIIVTNDKGTINAINNTVERILSSSLFPRAAKFVMRERKYVMTHDDFLNNCGVNNL